MFFSSWQCSVGGNDVVETGFPVSEMQSLSQLRHGGDCSKLKCWIGNCPINHGHVGSITDQRDCDIDNDVRCCSHPNRSENCCCHRFTECFRVRHRGVPILLHFLRFSRPCFMQQNELFLPETCTPVKGTP